MLCKLVLNDPLDYRFFIGFKLLINEQEVNLKNLHKSAKNTLTTFLREVNHKLMNDFVVMPQDEIRRFTKMADFLQSKIERRFQIHPLNKDDFGYVIEHIYGKTSTAFEDYAYPLPLKKQKETTLVKRYDLIKPTRSLIEENQRYLKIQNEEYTLYVAYFTSELSIINAILFFIIHLESLC